MSCPFCDADKAELVSQYASQLLFSQYRCVRCGSYFEGLREDLRAARSDDSPGGDVPSRASKETS